MCEMSDKWVREGVEIGEMKKAKETAQKMAQRGTAVDVIADLLDVSVSLVKQWLDGSTALAK